MSDTEEIIQTEDIMWSRALDLRIKERSKEAEDNLKFLKILGVPCEEVVSLDPANLPSILPHLHKMGATWDFDEVTIFAQLAFGGERSIKQYINTKVQRHLRTTNNE
eukprot:15179218-Ditylum_brightwellii.AAC.1